MILYDYECQNCAKEFTKILPMSDSHKIQVCPECGGFSQKIFKKGHGGIRCDSANDVSWLSSACETLLPDGHRPLESRSEYKRYLNQHGIIERG